MFGYWAFGGLFSDGLVDRLSGRLSHFCRIASILWRLPRVLGLDGRELKRQRTIHWFRLAVMVDVTLDAVAAGTSPLIRRAMALPATLDAGQEYVGRCAARHGIGVALGTGKKLVAIMLEDAVPQPA